MLLDGMAKLLVEGADMAWEVATSAFFSFWHSPQDFGTRGLDGDVTRTSPAGFETCPEGSGSRWTQDSATYFDR